MRTLKAKNAQGEENMEVSDCTTEALFSLHTAQKLWAQQAPAGLRFLLYPQTTRYGAGRDFSCWLDAEGTVLASTGQKPWRNTEHVN